MKIDHPIIEPLMLSIDMEHYLNVIKEITVTESFLSSNEQIRGCQEESNDECTAIFYFMPACVISQIWEISQTSKMKSQKITTLRFDQNENYKIQQQFHELKLLLNIVIFIWSKLKLNFLKLHQAFIQLQKQTSIVEDSQQKS